MADLRSQIKTALKKAGLDENLIDQIKVEKEEDVEKAVNDLKTELDELKKLSSADFLVAVDKAGLSEPLKAYLQSEADRRVAEAIKTHDAKLKLEADKLKPKTKEDTVVVDDKTSPELKAVLNLVNELKTQNASLSEKIETVVKENSETKISTAIKASLKEAGLDENFSKYVHVNSVEEVGSVVQDLSDRITTKSQQLIDKKLEEKGAPTKGISDFSGSEFETMVAAAAKKGSNDVGGGGLVSEQVAPKQTQ